MRRVTAERLQAAKQTVPHFYLNADCAMDAALRLRARLNERDPDLGLTLTDIIVRAAALALREVPAANSAWGDGAVRLFDTADVAVAVDTPGGLIHTDHSPGGRQEPAGDLAGAEVAERARPGGRADAGGVHRRHVHHLQPRDVRRRQPLCHRQPAAELHPRGRRGAATAGRHERRRRGCDHRCLHAVRGSPRHRRRHRRPIPRLPAHLHRRTRTTGVCRYAGAVHTARAACRHPRGRVDQPATARR